MIFPPSILRIRIVKKGKKKLGLWLPVFLLWPVILALLVLLLPLLFVLAICLRRGAKGRMIVGGLPQLLVIACALRGLKVDVEEDDQRIQVSLR